MNVNDGLKLKEYALEWSIKRHSEPSRDAEQVVADARIFETYLKGEESKPPPTD